MNFFTNIILFVLITQIFNKITVVQNQLNVLNNLFYEKIAYLLCDYVYVTVNISLNSKKFKGLVIDTKVLIYNFFV